MSGIYPQCDSIEWITSLTLLRLEQQMRSCCLKVKLRALALPGGTSWLFGKDDTSISFPMASWPHKQEGGVLSFLFWDYTIRNFSWLYWKINTFPSNPKTSWPQPPIKHSTRYKTSYKTAFPHCFNICGRWCSILTQ